MPVINDTIIREMWSKIKKYIPHKLNDLDEDCKIYLPTENQILKYNGSRWVNSNPQSYSQQQSNWNTTDTTSVSYIQNKPTSMPASDVSSWAKAASKPTYTKSEVGLGNVDNVKQYSASNPPPYPVTSVNSKTGAVTLAASDVGALPDSTVVPQQKCWHGVVTSISGNAAIVECSGFALVPGSLIAITVPSGITLTNGRLPNMNINGTGLVNMCGGEVVNVPSTILFIYDGEQYRQLETAQSRWALQAFELTSTCDVRTGGTGKSSLTAGSYLVGNGTSAINLKTPAQVLADILAAPLASPALTGTPTAPTAAVGTNTTQIATTAFTTSAIASALADITGISYQVVASLPATGQVGVIYLLSNSGTAPNIYDEYIWTGSAFEKIGTTDVDLSNYVQTTDLVAVTNAEIDTIVAS